MPLNASNRYLLDDYLKDKKAVAKDGVTATQGTTGIPATMLRERMKSGLAPNAMSAQTKPVTSTPTESVTSTPTKTATDTQTGTQTGNNTGLTENDVNSMLTTDHVQTQMNNVLTEFMDFMNREFQYNAKESPLYTILQQQAAKEARIASGRAYSRAVANAGGFGSSYATLAAEEASRQVMEGLDDQQLALYQAAKDEWDSRFSSLSQQYSFLSSAADQLKAQETEAQDLVSSAIAAVRNGYGTDYNEAAITADLQAMGLNEEQIATVLANQKQYADAINTQTENGVIPESVRDAAAEWQAMYGTAYSSGLMKAFLQAKGYTDEEINGAMEAQKNLAKGEILDQVSMVDTENEAIDYGNMLGEALRNGTITQSEWQSAIKTSSAVIRKEYVDKESLGGADVSYAAKLMKNGVMTGDDFREILKEGFKRDIKDIKTEKGKKFNTLAECRDLLDKVYGILVFVEDGYMTREEAKQVVSSFLDDETIKEFYDKMDKIEGENGKIARLEGVNSEEDKAAWEFMKEVRGSAS